MDSSENRIVAVSMGADPLTIGHVMHIKAAAKLGRRLVVILNNDNWLMKKKGYVFMPEEERKGIIESIEGVAVVMLSFHEENDDRTDVSKELSVIRPGIFAKGGDRDLSNLPKDEIDFCEKLGIRIVCGVGGGKIQSSSWLINDVVDRVMSQRLIQEVYCESGTLKHLAADDKFSRFIKGLEDGE